MTAPVDSRLLVMRLLTIGIAITSLVELGVFGVAISGAPASTSLLLVVAPLLLDTLIPLGAAAVAFAVGIRTLRVLNAITLLGALCAIPLWGYLFDILTMNPVGPQAMPWIVLASAPNAIAAVIVWNGPRGWIVLIAASLIRPLEILVHSPSPLAVFTAFDVVLLLLSALLLGGLALALLTSSRTLDDVQSLAAVSAAATAHDRAVQTAQDQADALVHDEILATLLAAGDPRLRVAVTGQARRSLRQIEELTAECAGDAVVTGTEFVHQLRLTTVAIDASTPVVAPARLTLALPPEVAAAFLGAARQALTNSVAHAGTSACRRVVIDVDGERIEVGVHDDGVGFDAASVSPERLGISVSIVERMNAVAGGGAAIASTPGLGTSVQLSWQWPLTVARVVPARRTFEFRGSPARAAAAVFLLTQFVFLATSLAHTSNPWPSLVSFVAITTALVLMTRRRFTRPGPRCAWVVVIAAVVASAAVFFQDPGATAPRYEVWQLLGVSFVLLGLALHDRQRLAVLGTIAMVALTLGGCVANGSGWLVGTALLVRPLSMLVLGMVTLGVLARMQRRAVQVRERELTRLADGAFQATMAASRQAHAARLRDLAGDLLEVLATDRALTREQLARCVTLEGFLRDRVRGDRLARGPLVEAVDAARRRGIDVQLLDDGTGQLLDDGDLLGVQQWASAHLAGVDTGEFVARLLPAGRSFLATIVTQNGSARSIEMYRRADAQPIAWGP